MKLKRAIQSFRLSVSKEFAMLTIFIIIAVVLGFYTGYRRGLIMQVIRLIGYIVTFILATKYYDTISTYVEMLIPFPAVQQGSYLAIYTESESFMLDQAFYNAITFLLIGIVGWLVTNFLAMFFTRLSYYDVMKYANYIGGGFINAMVTYVIIFILLYILSLIPIEFIQQQFVDNPLAFWIVDRTPFLADFAKEMWMQVNPIS